MFGCPAQIFIKPSARANTKLSDRSVQGTFLGMSTRGNGYIFLVPQSRSMIEVDSKDVLFNETFSDCRDQKGRIIPHGAAIRPDLHADPDFDSLPTTDGVIAPPQHNVPIPTSNRYESLSDPTDSPMDTANSDTADIPRASEPTIIASPAESSSPVSASSPPKAFKASKFWTYEVISPSSSAPTPIDRRNDGPKLSTDKMNVLCFDKSK